MSERISRRAEQRDRRRNRAVRIQPIRPIENKLPPLNSLDGEGEQKIHNASMQLLRDRGMLIVDHWQRTGRVADVVGL